MVNSLPFLPTRVCLKMTGPLGVAELDGCSAEQEQRRAEHDCNAGAGHVHKTLDHVAVTNGVRVFPDVVQIQAREREESAISAVEILDFFFEFQVLFFLEA